MTCGRYPIVVVAVRHSSELFVVKIIDRGPLEKGFLISTSPLPGVVRRTEGGEDGSPNNCCFTVAAIVIRFAPPFRNWGI